MQRGHGIPPARRAAPEDSRPNRDGSKCRGCQGQRQRIIGLLSELQALDKTGCHKRSPNADGESDEHQQSRLAEDHPQHVGALDRPFIQIGTAFSLM